MRRTKIVCTIGPASQTIEVLEQLILDGMDVARLNFSHGTHEEHLERIKAIRQAMIHTGKRVALMLDTKGPEIRTGNLQTETIILNEGEQITLTTDDVLGDENRLSVSYRGLPQDVKPGNMILIADGLIGLKVLQIKGNDITCEIVNGGEIGSRKNVNVPGVAIRLPGMTQKDVADINFGIDQKIDFIAASFVRRASDILDIRRILEERGADIHVIAKIENQEGVDNLDEIVQVADGVMVARGDLGVEIPTEEVPLVQKLIIDKCNLVGKPVITATQMLESMVRNPRPTRAEASDVANAIFDGTDAIMLSGETAAGKYPVEAVKTMARIARRAEKSVNYREIIRARRIAYKPSITDAISHATCSITADLGGAAIITATTSGITARTVAKYRPEAPIIATTPSERVAAKLCLIWGVYPVLVEATEGTDRMIEEAIAAGLKAGLVRSGDLVVITAGVPAGVAGSTNLIKVHLIAEVLVRGMGVGTRGVVGRVCVALTPTEAMAQMRPGDILVTRSTDREFVPAMEKAAAIITEEGGLTSHAAIVGLTLGIPTVVGAFGAVEKLKDGELITVDSIRGQIYHGVTKVL
ncbi:MAG: pyruvate kinase [Syntrophomonadaceae bacterium]|nr:pyruvate kinase [Syntrophomonadaceae bacterium]